MRIFISTDIEGVAGISDWSETGPGDARYTYFAEEMSKEAAAAAAAAIEAGAEVLVRDAHGSARNMTPALFPRGVEFYRNWSGDPRHMMEGLDDTFDACFMIGYHSAAGSDGNPLSHTMSSSKLFEITINGQRMSECMINSMIASYYGVPLIFLAGDKALCEGMQETIPGLRAVATNAGVGAASYSLHPEDAAEAIKRGAKAALAEEFPAPLAIPDSIDFRITYKDHHLCYKKSFYPGMERVDERTLRLSTDNFYEVMRFLCFAI